MLVSTANTGYFLVKKRNPKTVTEKLSFNKYDPIVRKHVLFKEEKLRKLEKAKKLKEETV